MDRIFLFDLGNVLAKSLDDYGLYNKLNCKISYYEFLQYWWGDDLVLKAHMGLATDDEHVEALLKFCKSDLSIKQFYEIYNGLDNSLYDDTVEIINDLKNKGYKIGILSNLRLMDYKRYKQQIEKINFDYLKMIDTLRENKLVIYFGSNNTLNDTELLGGYKDKYIRIDEIGEVFDDED